MLAKKINPNWFPAENRGLKVGEIIEMGDLKQLVVNGDVVPVDKNGIEISSYELYGVITNAERTEFEEYLKIKKATALKDTLEKEQEELKSQIEKKEVVESVKVSEPEKPAPKPAPNTPPFSAKDPVKKEKLAVL